MTTSDFDFSSIIVTDGGGEVCGPEGCAPDTPLETVTPSVEEHNTLESDS